MKSEIFSLAINNRTKIKFLYGMKEVLLDPYLITKDKNGKKVIYGKVFNLSEIKIFEYKKISNIKVLYNIKFSPIIPILRRAGNNRRYLC